MSPNKKIRILFVHHFSGMGGATMSLFYIIEKLDPGIFEVEVLFLDGEGAGVKYYREHGIKTHLLPGISLYPHAENSRISFIGRKPWKPVTLLMDIDTSVRKMLSFLETQEKFDIIHLNTSLLLAAGKAAKLSGAKVVWHIREPLYQGLLGIRKRFVQRWIKKYADQIFTISRVEADRLGASEKIQVVYNYVDFKKFDHTKPGDAIRKEFNISDNDFVVCNLGGTVHSKGADIYAEAATILCRKYDNIKFILVGYTGDVNKRTKPRAFDSLKQWLGLKHDLGFKVQAIREANQLHEKLILTGLRTDIPEILAASDVLAWTATVPHFSRPIIEAGAMGKAVVASDFPSTHEALKDNVNGLLCIPHNASDLAKKIEYLYQNPDVAKKMGAEGNAFARQRFNAEINFNVIREGYQRLVSKR